MAISINVSAPSAIANRDDLKAWIAEEVDRDLASIDANLDRWILMAEARFNRDLRCGQMEKTTTGAVTGEDTPLPTDYIAMRAIYVEGSPDRPLMGIAPSAIRQSYDGTAGSPLAYTLISGNLRLVPPPDGEVLITMDYWGRIDPLSAVAPSNWLLESHPDAYVTAVMFHFYRWEKDRQSAIDANALCEGIVQRINAEAKGDRFGAGPLVPNTVRQVWGAKC